MSADFADVVMRIRDAREQSQITAKARQAVVSAYPAIKAQMASMAFPTAEHREFEMLKRGVAVRDAVLAKTKAVV